MTTILAAIALGLPQLPAETIDAWAAPAGMQVLRMHLTEGDVVVYLPSRIAAGDVVSGAAYLEPAGGRTDVVQNEAVLASHAIEVMGSTISLSSSQFSTRAPADGSPIVIALKSKDGGTAATMKAGSGAMGASIDEPAACPVVEHGTAIRVVGRFDGSRETTMAWIDGAPAGVIAEGSRDCVVSTMNAGVGPHRLRIREGGVESEHMVNVVRLDVKPPVDARVGRKTAIEVVVDGLEEAPADAFPLKVVLSNSTPKLFPFGENSELLVAGNEVANGRWAGKIEFKPKGKGNFSMGARLVCDAFLKRIGL